jgi:hypothetical protein
MRALALVSLVVLGGCFNPDDIFPLKGTVESVAPVEGQVVRLLRSTTAGNFGPCTGSDAKPFKETVAAADGRYSFDVFRAQAQSLTNFSSSCFRVEATFASGSQAWSAFTLSGETEVAPLRDWRAHPRVEADVLVLDPPFPYPMAAMDPSEQVTTLDLRGQLFTADGGLVWQVDDQLIPLDGGAAERVPMPLEGYALEDFASSVKATAFINEPRMSGVLSFGDSVFSTTLVAGEPLVLQGTKTPVSRGAACSSVTTPCPLTDGELTVVEVDFREALTIDWGEDKPVSALVLRGVETGLPGLQVTFTQVDGGAGFNGFFVLPVSARQQVPEVVRLPDGGFDFPTAGSFYSVLAIDGGAPSSKVTLRFPAGVTRAAEISVFE